MSKISIPDWAIIYKEPGKTIKVKNGKYYLYSQTGHYNKKTKKRYTTNTYLGRITKEQGFISTRKNNTLISNEYITKSYGAYALFQNVGLDILERLKIYFGDYANLIFTIACLRCIERTPYSELEDTYMESYFSIAYKELNMSKSYLSNFLTNLSKNRKSMVEFMKEDVERDDIVIFDGTNNLCTSKNISYNGYGYKHGHNYASQYIILYSFSVSKRTALFYRILEGSISDRSTIEDVMNEFDVKNIVALLDNGFESDSNLCSLLKENDKYILALKRSSKQVSEEILNDTSRNNYIEVFNNEGDAIYAYETKNEHFRICVYFNQKIAQIETATYIERMNKGEKNYTKENFVEAKKRFGIYVIKTNIKDFSLQTIYEYYKLRFLIEYMFDTLKNTLEYDKSFMHKDSTLESWVFINHITLILTQRIYLLLQSNKKNITLSNLYKKLRQIKVQRNLLDNKEEYVLQHIPAKTRELISDLSISLN